MGGFRFMRVVALLVAVLMLGPVPAGALEREPAAATKDVPPWVSIFDRPANPDVKLIDAPPIESPPVEVPDLEVSDRSFASTPVTDGSGKVTLVGAHPKGDKDAAQPDVVREIQSERSANQQVFERADGSRLVKLYSEPRFFLDPTSREFRPIDVSIEQDENRSAWLQSTANAWTVSFGPIGGGGGVEIATGAGSMRLEPVSDAAVSPLAGKKDGTVEFPQVWRGVDLRETVTPVGVKEDIVIGARTSPSRVEFTLHGGTARPNGEQDGGLVLEGQAGTFAVPPPRVVDSRGVDVTKESVVTYEVLDGGTQIAVTVGQAWLSGLSEDRFPLVVDPAVTLDPTGVGNGSWGSGQCGVGCSASDGRVGNSAGQTWRSTAHFAYEGYLNASPGWQVLDADFRVTWTSGQRRLLRVFQATSGSYNGAVAGGPVLPQSGPLIPPNGPASVGFDVTDTMRDVLDTNVAGALFGLRVDDETESGSMGTYSSELFLSLSQPPPATTVSSPTSGAVVSTLTPTVKANTVVDPNGDAVAYNFQITTDAGAASGSVLNSGWKTALPGVVPTWDVPAGALFDGASYWVRVYTFDYFTYSGLSPLPAGAAVKFRVGLNLGDGGPSPVDTAGSVSGVTSSPSAGAPSPGLAGSSVTVNLVDGNLAMGVPTRSIGTAGGSIAPSLTYNSQSTSTRGLLGEYYADLGTPRTFDASDRLVLQRTDPAPNFSWQFGTPGAGVANGAFLARWSGGITLPSSGTWRFGVRTQYGARVFIDGQSVTDDWTQDADGPVVWGADRTFTANVARQLKVEGWSDNQVGNPAGVTVYAGLVVNGQLSSQVYELDPSWLRNTASILPDGWSFSVGAGGASILGLHDLGASVVVIGTDGSTAEFERLDAEGGYRPPPGSDAHLTVDENGEFVLQGGGLIYRFESDGQIASITSAVDDRHPAAPTYNYTGSPARPASVVDPVAGATVTFIYGTGDPQSGGYPCVAPAGKLCRIDFSDGGTSSIYYANPGVPFGAYSPDAQVSAVTNASAGEGTYTGFGYDTAGRLSQIRDPLATQALQYQVRPVGAPVNTEIAYANGKVASVTGPEPTTGADRQVTTYTYAAPPWPITTVNITGFTPTTGYARLVVFDARGRVVQENDASGLATTYAWDESDRVVSSTDPAGLRTTSAFDSAGHATDSWGPAPAAWFGTNNQPVATHVSDVPHATMRYDEGIVGLAGVAWSNADLAGNPALHQTTFTGSTLSKDWGQLPPAPLTQGAWSLRGTGTINLATSGSYRFSVQREGAARIWIDDQLVVDAPFGSGASSDTDVTLTAGSHRLRLEYRHTGSTDASLTVRWQPPGGGSQVAIPTSAIKPGYGLLTSGTDADGLVTATEYSDPAHGIDPAFGLPTAQIVDPGGLALTTSTTYETPSTATYLRRLSKTMPAGDTSNYTYYTGTQGPLAPVCGVSGTTRQAGFLKEATGPDPDGAGAQLSHVEQYVYDLMGRAVGTREGNTSTIGSAGWACTTYDGRGRQTQQTWPAHAGAPARTVDYTYAWGGDPTLASVKETALADNIEEVMSAVDILGRPIAYAAGGVGSFMAYDRVGRQIVTASSIGTQTYTYETTTGRPSSTLLDSTTLATASYNVMTGRVSSVAYSNSTTAGFGYDPYGRPNSVTVSGPSSVHRASESVTRSLAGRVVDQTLDPGSASPIDLNPGGNAYSYDGAGRLTTAWAENGWPVTYGYADTSACTSNDAGRDTNRTSFATLLGSTGYCYDRADRLVSATGNGPISSVSYDDHGNTTSIGPSSLSWDSADRHTNTADGATALTFTRDPLDRIVTRQFASTAQNTTQRLRYTGFGDVTDVLVDAGNTVIERYLALPGGVNLTLAATGQIWSYADLHGDIMLTANSTGTATSLRRHFSAYGTGTVPDTTSYNSDLGYLGQHGRSTDHEAGLRATIEMGARPYDPSLGRFLSVDPVEGGCANDYAYVYGDPINSSDRNGTGWLGDAWNGVKSVARSIGNYVSDHRCAILLALGVGAAVASVLATGGGAAFAWAALSAGLSVAAPLSVGDKRGAEESAALAALTAGLSGIGVGVARTIAGSDRAAGSFLIGLSAIGGSGINTAKTAETVPKRCR